MKKKVWMMNLLLMISISIFAQKSPVFNPADGAIHGYDPVAYFTDGKAVKGVKQFTYEWNTATWYFSNKQNLDAFKASPEKYAPQYGGYCAYGLADGHKAPTDPEAWLIKDGKLYFNYNKDVQQMWKKKQAEYIIVADKKWPDLKDKE